MRTIPDGDLLSPAEAAAHAFDAVGDDGLAVAGAAQDDAALEFTAQIDGVEMSGVHLIRFDLEGRIVDFTVLVRPFDAADRLWRKMAEALQDE